MGYISSLPEMELLRLGRSPSGDSGPEAVPGERGDRETKSAREAAGPGPGTRLRGGAGSRGEPRPGPAPHSPAPKL